MQLTLNAQWIDTSDGNFTEIHVAGYHAAVALVPASLAPGEAPRKVIEAAVSRGVIDIATRSEFATMADAREWAEQIIIAENL